MFRTRFSIAAVVESRPFASRDLAAVAALERKPFATPWGARRLEREAGRARARFDRVLRENGRVVGYLFAAVAAGEMSLERVAVAPEHRGRGLGDRLIRELLEGARARSCTLCVLEVATDNAAAIALYHRHGFAEIGRRKGYYEREGKDATLMARRLDGAL